MAFLTHNVSVLMCVIIAAVLFILGIMIGYLAGRRAGEEEDDRDERRGRGEGEVEIYVGNLSYDVSERDLQKAFESYGKIVSARIIKNRFNGKSKGFGFVEMADRNQSMDAVRALNGKDLKGRRIVVNEAKSSSRE